MHITKTQKNMFLLLWCIILLVVGAEKNFTIDDYIDLLSPASKVYGPVHKEGMVPIEVWSRTDFENGPQKIFNEWYKDPSKRYTVPPLSSYCRIFVNHKHKLIFVRNKKAASTTFIEGFNNICGKDEDWTEEDSTRFWSAFKTKKFLGDTKPESLWNSYTVFAVTRNPWARSFSAWKHVLSRDNKSPELLHDLLSQKGFEAFSREPYIIARKCDKHQECNDAKRPDYFRRHVEPFARCIKNAEGGLAVDYLLRYENLEEDWKAFEEMLNTRRGIPKIDEELKHCKKPTLQLSAEKFFEKCGLRCVKSLEAYYKEDLETFGYSVPHKMAEAIEAGVKEDWPMV